MDDDLWFNLGPTWVDSQLWEGKLGLFCGCPRGGGRTFIGTVEECLRWYAEHVIVDPVARSSDRYGNALEAAGFIYALGQNHKRAFDVLAEYFHHRVDH